MKRIYTTDNFMMAGQVQSLLESNQIDCFIKNANLTGGIGELPPTECWPEVWLNDDIDETIANRIISSFLKSNDEIRPFWNCNCGEKIEGQFTQCWKCGGEISN